MFHCKFFSQHTFLHKLSSCVMRKQFFQFDLGQPGPPTTMCFTTYTITNNVRILKADSDQIPTKGMTQLIQVIE